MKEKTPPFAEAWSTNNVNPQNKLLHVNKKFLAFNRRLKKIFCYLYLLWKREIQVIWLAIKLMDVTMSSTI